MDAANFANVRGYAPVGGVPPPEARNGASLPMRERTLELRSGVRAALRVGGER